MTSPRSECRVNEGLKLEVQNAELRAGKRSNAQIFRSALQRARHGRLGEDDRVGFRRQELLTGPSESDAISFLEPPNVSHRTVTYQEATRPDFAIPLRARGAVSAICKEGGELPPLRRKCGGCGPNGQRSVAGSY
jgi:hypothetical protein